MDSPSILDKANKTLLKYSDTSKKYADSKSMELFLLFFYPNYCNDKL